MREILFRGKKKSDKKWIYGNLLQTDNITYVIQNYALFDGIGKYEIDPETVCQYTGLTDRNGRKIFENDVVKLEDYHGHRTVYVFYGEDCGCWFYGGDGFSDEYIFNGQQKEVIGNYFDNEDLLGE